MSATACNETVKMPEGKQSTGFLGELNTLPVVKSTTNLLSSAQEQSRVLRTGMAIFEYSFTTVLGKFHVGSTLFSSIDSVAEKGIVTLKEKYPIVTQTPHELQESAFTSVRKTVRTAMKTPPGQIMMSGLDWALQKSTATLKRLANAKQATKPAKDGSKVSAEHAYASEDSGACEPEVKPTKTAKEPHTALSALTEKDTLFSKAYKLGIVYPIERMVALLKYLRRFLGGSKRSDKLSTTAGTSGSQVSKRTIKSPRKRIQTTFFTRMKNTVYKFLGVQSGSRILGMMFRGASKEPISPGKAERKRAHDEILTDEDSESDEDMANFDLEKYASEDDPDYEPPEQDSGEDSEGDSSEGEIESDLEDVIEDAKADIAKIKPKSSAAKNDSKSTQETKDSTSKTSAPAENAVLKPDTDSKKPLQKSANESSKNTVKDNTTTDDVKSTKDAPKPTHDTKISTAEKLDQKNKPKNNSQDVVFTKDDFKSTGQKTKVSPPKKNNQKVPESATGSNEAQKADQPSTKHSQKSKGKSPTVALEDISSQLPQGKSEFAGRVDGFEIIHS